MRSTKGEASAINVVVAIIVLLIIALALIVVSTKNVTNLGGQVKSTIDKIFVGKGNEEDGKPGTSPIDSIINNILKG